jgi:hypothetical protein
LFSKRVIQEICGVLDDLNFALLIIDATLKPQTGKAIPKTVEYQILAVTLDLICWFRFFLDFSKPIFL